MSLLTGMLFLDYASDENEEEAHYEAKVTKATLHPDELVIEFTGHDAEEGKYDGACKLTRRGASFEGVGEFRASSGQSRATVSVTCEVETSTDLLLSGSWTEEGDSDAYMMQIDLQHQAA